MNESSMALLHLMYPWCEQVGGRLKGLRQEDGHIGLRSMAIQRELKLHGTRTEEYMKSETNKDSFLALEPFWRLSLRLFRVSVYT